MTTTNRPAYRPSDAQRRALTEAIRRGDGLTVIYSDVPRRTREVLVRHGWVTPVQGTSDYAVTDAGRAAIGAPTVDDAPVVAAETSQDAPMVCGTCGQALTRETNAHGRVLLVADDGWGSICGDAPTGEHAPAEDTVPVDDYSTPRVMVDYPGLGDAPVAGASEAVAQQAVTTGSRSAERTTFLADVLCAALEGGIGYWSAADSITRVSEETGEQCTGDDWPWRYDAVTLYETADGDDTCSLAVELAIAPDAPCPGHRVTLDTVASAVSRISKTRRDACPDAGGFAYRYVQTVRDASIENDACEVDADVADIIVQVAALGSVVYG